MSVADNRAEPAQAENPVLAAAYRACAEIARREARNFYYAFLALPRARRDAICAVYAFMRHADDLSDDESLTREQRRAELSTWLERWHRAASGQPASDPVFIALADARRRFNIPLQLLDDLVHGTAMDLDSVSNDQAAFGEAAEARPYDTYATFEELRRYCYYVASVVGLVCIRIFGYSDPRAEKLAEETGVAFQLTNILRDVREDIDRGRVYLPLEDLDRYNVRIDDLAAIRDGSQMSLNQRELLEGIATRAETYYQSGRRLLPLIAADARPALWVLITIYYSLLRRIRRSGYDVFSRRITVPLRMRIAILLRGLAQAAVNRIARRG